MTDYEQQRDAAIERLNAKRDFRMNLVAYVLVNGMLIVIWAMTGAGFFWPIFPMLGWGIGVALHWYTVYMVKPPSEGDIQREIDRM